MKKNVSDMCETDTCGTSEKIYPSYLKKRLVWWFVETYLEPKYFDLALSKASHWAYAYHDQDDSENHYHILLHFENARTGHAVLRDFPPIQNTMCKPADFPISCYDYLLHANDPNKYQYDPSIIVSDNPVYWDHFLPSIRDQTQYDFLDDLLNSERIDFVDMAHKYGRDWIKNYKVYLEYRDLVRSEFKFK